MIIAARPARITPLEYLAIFIKDRKAIPAMRRSNPKTRRNIVSSDLDVNVVGFGLGVGKQEHLLYITCFFLHKWELHMLQGLHQRTAEPTCGLSKLISSRGWARNLARMMFTSKTEGTQKKCV